MFPTNIPDVTDARLIDSYAGPCANLSLDWDVVVYNQAWDAVFTGMGAGDNLIEWLFLHPVAQRMPDWRTTARHFLLWYLDSQSRHGGSERAVELMRRIAAEHPATTSLLIDPDPEALATAWTEWAPITVRDDATGHHTTYAFSLSSPVAFDPHTMTQRPVTYCTLTGVLTTR